MKLIIATVMVFLAALLGGVGATSAATLDDYYLQRFGEGDRAHGVISGVAESPAEAPFERCYTPVYHALRHDWPKLAAATQQILAKYVARPALEGVASYDSPGGHFRIHYATTGIDAPPLTDSDVDGIPDWVETTATVFETVYAKEVGELLFTAAPAVNGQPYDVYLQNLGGGVVKYLGFTTSDVAVSASSYASYITIDNDFSEFNHDRYSELDYLQITAAHEYHHAIQYGYNYYFDIWYAEATSTWVEDEVYDSVNQLYDYLPAWFQNMHLPLNTGVDVDTGGGYGRWLYNRYLAEVWGRDVVRTVWTRLAAKGRSADGADIPMIPVLEEVIGGIGESLLGFGKRLASKDWSSHQDEISLIHPLLAQNGTSPLPISSFPGQPYSMAFFSYPLNSALSVDLSAKPAEVLTGTVSTGQSDILVLCNIGTGLSIPDRSGGGGGGGGGGCFIATAAFGSYLHPKVVVLREFRDRWLMTNPVGRMFVKGYYRFSPLLAVHVAHHEWLRRGCRALLSPLIAAIEHPETVASLVLGLLGWGLVRSRSVT